MIEAYSQNVTVNSSSNVPFEITKIDKGCYEDLSGSSSINLNHCGVYCVTVNGTVTPSEAGTFSVELFKDGVAQVDTLTQATVEASQLYPFSFTEFVQVSKNNSSCACSSPTVINVINTGVAAVYDNVKIAVDKVI